MYIRTPTTNKKNEKKYIAKNAIEEIKSNTITNKLMHEKAFQRNRKAKMMRQIEEK